MEIPIKMDDLGGKPHYFRKHPLSDNTVDGSQNPAPTKDDNYPIIFFWV